MKILLLVVMLAAAATAAVVSYEEPDLVEVPDTADGDELADEDVNEMPEVIVTHVSELSEETELPAQTAIASRSNLNLGSIDVLVYNQESKASAIPNQNVLFEIPVRTNSGRITAIRVNRVGDSQNASPSILNGGIGSSYVTIKLRSATSRGFHYRVQVYAK